MIRRCALAFAALTLVGALAACGGESLDKVVGTGTPARAVPVVKVEATPAFVARAAQRTVSAGSARMTFSVSMPGPGGRDLTMTGAGEFDGDRRLHMAMDMSAIGRAVGGSAPSGVFDDPVEMVIDGTVFYMKFPGLASMMGAGATPWMSFDMSAMPGGAGLSQALQGTAPTDPTAMLRSLEGASDVEIVGTEQVDGASTTHMAGSFSLRDAFARLPRADRDAVQSFLGGANLPDDLLDTRLHFDVYVDAQGLVRRTTMSFPLPVPGSDPSLMTFDMHLRDFGADVRIPIPSPRDVTDLTSMLSRMLPMSGV
jgi:hypothetical protein